MLLMDEKRDNVGNWNNDHLNNHNCKQLGVKFAETDSSPIDLSTTGRTTSHCRH